MKISHEDKEKCVNECIEQRLFPDTEILKDITQDFVGGDFASDLTQVMKYFTDVLSKKVGGQGSDEAF